MATPDKTSADDQICPICNKPISKHKPEQMLDCSRKIQEKYSNDGTDPGV